MTNEGTVRSDAEFLQLIDNDKTNTGTFEAVDGATLQISGIDVTNSGGQIIAEDASTVTLRNNARIIGGTLDTSGSGSILVDSGSAFLQDVTNDGTFGVSAVDNVQLENSFTNNGTVTVNSDGLNADTQLVAANSLTIAGTGEIVLNNTLGSTVPQRASIDSAMDQVLTQGADHTIRGNGRITTALVNNGLVNADDGLLQLRDGNKTNNNSFAATNSGELRLDLGVLVNNADGTITADNGTVSVRGGSEIQGGVIESLNGGTINIDSGIGALDGVTSNAAIDVTFAGDLQLENSFTNNGTVTVNSTGANADTELIAATSLTIDGTGEIVLNNTLGSTVPQRASIDAAAGATITQAAGHTISGNGRLTAALINNGLVSADGFIQLRDEDKTNNSSFTAVDGGELRLDLGVLVNNANGTITADNGTVSVRGGSEIQGGVIESLNGGTINIDSGIGALDGVTSNAAIDVTFAGDLQLENSFTNNGTVTVNSTGANADTELIAATSLTIDGTGEIVLNNTLGSTVPQRASIDAAAGATITQGVDHSIRGRGRITAALVNDGVVSAEGGLLQLRRW